MTAVLEMPVEKPELIQFRKQDAAIAQLAEQYMPLRIDGISDKQGFKAVHDARMVVKNTRIAVEKKRKELKEDALRYGQAVDAEARRLTALLEPIESHLQLEEDAVVNERERIKRAAEEAKRAALQKRLDALLAVGVVGNPLAVADMTEERFTASLAEATTAFHERQKAEAEAAAKRRQEEEALAAERSRLAEIKRQQDAEATRLAAERKKIEDQEAAHKRALELEAAKREAAEKARLETEQRIAREQAAAKAAEEAKAAKEKAAADAAEAARIKAEQERPQRERLLAVADAVASIGVPLGPGSLKVTEILRDAAKRIQGIANGPLE